METVLDLLSRLEDLVSRGAPVPLTDRRMIDEKEVVGLLRMIRARLPQDLLDTQQMRSDAVAMLHRAQEEARQIVLRAQEHAEHLADGHEVVAHARIKAEEMLDRARREAAETRAGGDEYAQQVLDDLEQGVTRVLMSIRKGREMLRTRDGE
jgi:vacuolar-type H+-ATPase subunit H